MLAWLHYFGPVARQCIVVAGCDLFTYLMARIFLVGLGFVLRASYLQSRCFAA
jgi:hypothetical protein